MKSEVENNKELIKTGDILYYIDCENAETFIVMSVDETGFKAIEQDSTISYHVFNELQIGWHISERTKTMHTMIDKFIYKTS